MLSKYMLKYIVLIIFLSSFPQGLSQTQNILIKQTVFNFIPDLPPPHYSIINPNQDVASSKPKSVPKDYFVQKVAENNPNKPSPMSITTPHQTVSEVIVMEPSKAKPNQQKPKISEKLPSIQFGDKNEIKFKADAVNHLEEIKQSNIMNPVPVIPDKPFSNPGLRTEPVPVTNGNRGDGESNTQNSEKEDHLKFIFSSLLILAVVVIIFGFPKRRDQRLTPVETEDEDEEMVNKLMANK